MLQEHHLGACAVLAIVALLTLWLRQGLTLVLNRFQDAGLAGDVAAGSRFDRLHWVSIMVNAVQIMVVLAVVVRVGLG